MYSPTLQRMLLVLTIQALLTIVGLFTEGPEHWSLLTVVVVAAIPPLVLLILYAVDFRKISLLARVLLGAAILFSCAIAGFFIFLVSLAFVYRA